MTREPYTSGIYRDTQHSPHTATALPGRLVQEFVLTGSERPHGTWGRKGRIVRVCEDGWIRVQWQAAPVETTGVDPRTVRMFPAKLWREDEVHGLMLVSHMQGWRAAYAGKSRGDWTPEKVIAEWPTPDRWETRGKDPALAGALGVIEYIRDLAEHEADDTPLGLLFDRIAKVCAEEVGE